jgi:hypothetical protein
MGLFRRGLVVALDDGAGEALVQTNYYLRRGVMNYPSPTQRNMLCEMKGGWQRLEMPILVKGSSDGCEMHVQVPI